MSKTTETKAKPTAGPFYIENPRHEKVWYICNGPQEHANVIGQAIDNYEETGLTPRELVERYEEAIKSLKECLEGVMELNGEYQEGWDDMIERAKQEIKKATE